jgi:tetratricopeptide (TPR) repeat protein
MRTITAMIAVAGTCLIVVCGPKRIEKLPVPAEDESRAIRLMAEGDELIREGKEHLAMVNYLEATRLNPYDERAFNKLATAYLRLGMYYQARRSVERAIGLERKYAHAYNTWAILHLVDNDLKDASKLFRKAIQLDPLRPSFHMNLGFAEVRKGNVEEGLRSYRRAYELNPDIFDGERTVELYLGEPVDSASYYQFALVFAELGKLGPCLWYLEKALTNGFDDFDRLLSEPILKKFEGLDEYREFLQKFGIVSNR